MAVMAKENDGRTDGKLLGLFGVNEVMDLPGAVMEAVTGDVMRRDALYRRLLELFDYDLGYDWFQKLYEREFAQRKKEKQDFTPPEVTRLTAVLAGAERAGTVHEPTAGTGGLLISVWAEKCSRVMPWEFRPSENMVTCWEISARAIPLLLLNLSIRGMTGHVYHGDVLERTVVQRYIVLNETDDSMGFSGVFKVDGNARIKEVKHEF